MIDPALLRALAERRLDALQSADPAALSLALLDHLRREGDVDALLSLGAVLAAAGQADMDSAALAWLAESPTSAHLERVCALLQGVWSHPDLRGELPAHRIRELLLASEKILISDQAAYDLAVTLLKALRCTPDLQLQAELRDRLRQLKARPFSNPTLRHLTGSLP